jgi:tRNA nucleotidyltransferase (CCA-adding enzyme)
MKTYLVGGAVRDQLLNLPVHERDWVVVGATIEDMLAAGFKPVGKEFPVFLHPESKEEYALARTEKKVSRGYKGFSFYTSPDISLEEDLLRRDLTINAIAQDDKGQIIDPYQGQQDLAAQCLRHVSPAFTEDPVRILRLARFNAKLPSFHIHPETKALVSQMLQAGEADALVPERVFAELDKALGYQTPWVFFASLQQLGALNIVMPDFHWSDQAQTRLQALCQRSNQASLRFAVSLSHLSATQANQLCQHLRAPKTYRELSLLLINSLALLEGKEVLDAKTQLDLLLLCDALRRPERLGHLLCLQSACLPDFKHNDRLMQALLLIKAVDIKALADQGLKGEALKTAIYQARLNAIAATMLPSPNDPGH